MAVPLFLQAKSTRLNPFCSNKATYLTFQTSRNQDNQDKKQGADQKVNQIPVDLGKGILANLTNHGLGIPFGTGTHELQNFIYVQSIVGIGSEHFLKSSHGTITPFLMIMLAYNAVSLVATMQKARLARS